MAALRLGCVTVSLCAVVCVGCGDSGSSLPSFPSGITITSPDGGETVYRGGTPYQITWSNTRFTGNVDIHYTTDTTGPADTWSWTEIASDLVNSGSHTWDAPSLDSTTCRIRVREAGGTGLVDVSNADFTISPPVILLTSPLGGESWAAGVGSPVTWTGGGFLNVRVEITRDGTWTDSETVGGPVSVEDGQYTCTISGPGTTGCYLRVSDWDDGVPSSQCATPFALVSLEVVTPAGGEMWDIGSPQTIQWNAVAMAAVDVELSRDGNWDDGDGSDVEVLAASRDATLGSMPWTPDRPISSACLVRVRDSAGVALPAVSPAFSVCGVRLLSPVGGEHLPRTHQYEITWYSVGGPGTVDIRYTDDTSGDPAAWVWHVIATGTADDASYQWTVPDTTSTTCRVRVAHTSSGPADESAADFTIRTRWYVDADATAGGDGMGWLTAVQHPRDALPSAAPGDEMWVAEGTYTNDAAGTDTVVVMAPGVAMYGGFAGTETTVDQRNPSTHPTILDGEDTASRVVEGADGALLDGFHVTRAYAEWALDGGGMYNYGGTITVRRCVFDSNYAGSGGGGIANYQCDALIEDTVFSGNVSGDDGGAVYTWYADTVIARCIFTGNTAGSRGGGFCSSHSTRVRVEDCTFTGNSAAQGGGVDFESDPDAAVTGCLFSQNTAGAGGALYTYGVPCDVYVSECDFHDNTGGGGGGALYSRDGVLGLDDCEFLRNTATGGEGGAMSVWVDELHVVGCSFVGNSCWTGGGGWGNGGAIWFRSDTLSTTSTFTNCLITGNCAGHNGGALNTYSGRIALLNCTVADNLGSSSIGGIHVFMGDGTLTNCIVWNNLSSVKPNLSGTLVANYSLVGPWADRVGTALLEDDPRFISPGTWDTNGTPGDYSDDTWMEGDYRLQSTSVCIDTGDPATTNPTDLNGDPRPQDSGYDMGVYEYDGS